MGAITCTAKPLGKLGPQERFAEFSRRNQNDLVRDGEWRDHFPVGYFIDMGGAFTNVRVVPGMSTVRADTNNAAGYAQLTNHPDVGAKATGLRYLWETAGTPTSQEGTQHVHQTAAADTRDGIIKMIPSMETNVNTYLAAPSDAAAITVGNAVQTYYGTNPGVLGVTLHDDVANSGSEWQDLFREVKATDPHDRFASAVIFSNEASLGYPLIEVAYKYNHPLSHYGDGTDQAEGDLHRNDGADLVEYMRANLAGTDPRTRHWWQIQTHRTYNITGTRVTELRYPTPREIVHMAGIMIAEGAKGLFFFTWTDGALDPGTGTFHYAGPMWDGLGAPAAADRLAACTEVARRLSPGIRARLLRCNKDVSRYAVSGGGSTGLPVNYGRAHCTTLHDAEANTDYVVIVNRSLSTAAITVTDDSHDISGGSITNLETGIETDLGNTVTLGPLDWGIYQYSDEVIPTPAPPVPYPRPTGELWRFKAEGLGYNDNEPVDTWTELSGNNKHATATGTARPTFKTGIINGKAVVRFDGVNDCLTIPATDMTGTQTLTLYIVMSTPQVVDGMVVENGPLWSNAPGGFAAQHLANGTMYAGNRSTSNSQFITDPAVTVNSTPALVRVVYDMAKPTNEVTIWVNQYSGIGTRSPNTNNTGNFGNRTSFIGARNNSSLYFNGDIAEIVLINRALTDVEVDDMDDYLLGEYGLTGI